MPLKKRRPVKAGSERKHIDYRDQHAGRRTCFPPTRTNEMI